MTYMFAENNLQNTHADPLLTKPVLGPKKEYLNYLVFHNRSLLSDNQIIRGRRANKCEGNPLKFPKFTVPMTC